MLRALWRCQWGKSEFNRGIIPSDVQRLTSQVAQPRATELKKKYCKIFCNCFHLTINYHTIPFSLLLHSSQKCQKSAYKRTFKVLYTKIFSIKAFSSFQSVAGAGGVDQKTGSIWQFSIIQDVFQSCFYSTRPSSLGLWFPIICLRGSVSKLVTAAPCQPPEAGVRAVSDVSHQLRLRRTLQR